MNPALPFPLCHVLASRSLANSLPSLNLNIFTCEIATMVLVQGTPWHTEPWVADRSKTRADSLHFA